MRRLASALVILVALGEAAVVGLFAALSLSGDSLGIARGMAILLAVPLLAGALPALLLLRAGRAGLALTLALLSLPATWLLWRSA